MTRTGDDFWLQPDGSPLACQEKLRVLADNQAEVLQVTRDAFEDAVLMGVDPEQFRARLHAIVDALQDPRRT